MMRWAMTMLCVVLLMCVSMKSHAEKKNGAAELHQKGLEALSSSQYFEAIKIFQEAIKTYPEKPENYYQLAFIYGVKFGDEMHLEKAVEVLNLAFKNELSDKRLKSLLAQMHFAKAFAAKSKSDLKKAIEVYGTVILDDEKNAEALSKLGDLYGLEKQNDKSVNFHKKALVINDKLAEAHQGLGQVALLSDDYKTAETSLIKALDLNSDLELARAMLATVYIKTDRAFLAKGQVNRIKNYALRIQLQKTMGLYQQRHTSGQALESCEEQYYVSKFSLLGENICW